jgi:hypothetical protein
MKSDYTFPSSILVIASLQPLRLLARFFVRFAPLLVALLWVPGCGEEKGSLLTREQMWDWLGQQVYTGMPIEAASAAMEKAGFACSSFAKTSTKIVDIHKAATTDVFDFVKCEREDGDPPIKRHWEITLVHEGALVKMIGLRQRDIYPPTK